MMHLWLQHLFACENQLANATQSLLDRYLWILMTKDMEFTTYQHGTEIYKPGWSVKGLLLITSGSVSFEEGIMEAVVTTNAFDNTIEPVMHVPWWQFSERIGDFFRVKHECTKQKFT